MLALRMIIETLLVLLSCCLGLHASNYSYAAIEDDWLNAYLSKEDLLQRTRSAAANVSQMQTTISAATTSTSTTLTASSGSNLEDLQQQQIIYIVLIALVLHVLVVSAGFLIYCWCNTKATENSSNDDRSGNTEWFGMQCVPMHHNYAPDLKNCPCPGCEAARKLCIA